MRLINSFLIALGTYSRIPVPEVPWTDENRRYTMCFFPVIGLIIGGLMWLWLWLCRLVGIGALLQGAVGAVIPLLVTGGIHMDGLMDVSDALASWQPKEKKLEILKDSRVGAFAVMTCVGYMLIGVSLLSEAGPADGPLIGMGYVLSRALSAWALAALRSARPGGMLDGFARTAHRRLVTASSAAWAAVCLVVWAVLGGWLALIAAAAALLMTLYYRHMAYRQFGGVTGDLAGWYSQMTELCCVAAIILGRKIL